MNWTSYETLKSKMKPTVKFCLCLHKFSELWNSFPLVPTENCFWCYFRQLFMYLALRKCKTEYKILKIILVPDFCPLIPEIPRFSTGFRLQIVGICLVTRSLRGPTPTRSKGRLRHNILCCNETVFYPGGGGVSLPPRQLLHRHSYARPTIVSPLDEPKNVCVTRSNNVTKAPR